MADNCLYVGLGADMHVNVGLCNVSVRKWVVSPSSENKREHLQKQWKKKSNNGPTIRFIVVDIDSLNLQI